MTSEPSAQIIITPANHFLWAVKTYLDLISGDRELTYGSGLKRLYVFSGGLTTFNVDDIENITAKAEEYKLISEGLRGFMNKCIVKNLFLYSQEMHRMIAERIVLISQGVVTNPDSFIIDNIDEGRRSYYTPPANFLQQIQKTIADDISVKDWSTDGKQPIIHTYKNAAVDAVLLLTRMQSEEGHSTPAETSWGFLMRLVESMMELLECEVRSMHSAATYMNRPLAIAKILWVITKMLIGDLTICPRRRDTNLVDLDAKINMSDGTLAAIPFPLQKTVEVFADENYHSVSMKGRTYLSAVSAAAFYRQSLD